MSNRPSIRSHLAMSVNELRKLLSRMDAGRSNDHPRRRAARHPFGVSDIPISITQPEGGQTRFLAFGRNISPTGASILHGGYVYPGSECRIVLRQENGSPIVVSGVIRHCRLVEGACHEIGIEFEERIDPDGVPGVEVQERVVEVEEVPTGPLTGSVIIADAWAASARLIERQLETLGLDVTRVDSSGAMLDAVRKSRFDALVIALDTTGEHGSHAITSVAAADPTLPVIMLVDHDAAAEEIRGQGVSDVIVRPYPFELLAATLQARLGGSAPLDEVHSSALGRPGMVPIVNEFVRSALRSARDLRAALRQSDMDALSRIAYRLRAIAESVGFNDVTIESIRLLGAIENDGNVEEVTQSLITLLGSLVAANQQSAA